VRRILKLNNNFFARLRAMLASHSPFAFVFVFAYMALAAIKLRATWIVRAVTLAVGVAALMSAQVAYTETLDQAWASALAVNHRLASGRYLTEAAQKTLQAAEATRWPTVALQGGYTRLNETPTAVGSLTLPPPLPPSTLDFSLPLQQENFYMFKTEVTLPLYTGGRIERGIAAANALVGASQNDEARLALDVKLAVAQAYVASLRAARFIEVAQSNVASLTSFLKDVMNLFEQGVVARNDTLAASAALADAQQRLIVARNALNLAHASYNRLLGRDLTELVTLQELPMPPMSVNMSTSNIAALTLRAHTIRPELSMLANQGDALRAQSASVRGGLAPQVALIGGYTRQQNRYQAHEGIASVGVGVKWDLFDGGLVRAQSDALSARAASVAALREESLSLIALQVRQAWLNTQETTERREVASAAVASADENLKLARDRYSQGLANNTEVLEAETQRTRSTTNFHSATYDALLAQLQLKRATGEL
jgi:outer membrane protein